MNQNKKEKVFISYSKNDSEVAKRIFNILKNMGMDPWLDDEKLLPGQPWKIIISEAIKESKYFLALLSSNSVNKKGYVQKELKIALDVLDEFSPLDIYLIPVRINECHPLHENLRNLQWVDLFPSFESGLDKIIKVLTQRYSDSDDNLYEKEGNIGSLDVPKYKGYRYVEEAPLDVIQSLYDTNSAKSFKNIKFIERLNANEFLILRNGKSSVLARYDKTQNILVRIDKKTLFEINPLTSGQTFALECLTNNKLKLVTITGRPNTGKTMLAFISSLSRIKYYSKIFYSLPIISLSSTDTNKEPSIDNRKFDLFSISLNERFEDFKERHKKNTVFYEKLNELYENQVFNILPLSMLLQYDLSESYVIIDESQNLTELEIKNIILRAGQKTKIVFIGNLFQMYHPSLNAFNNGLIYLIERMKNQNIYSHINIERGILSELAELANALL